MCSVAIQATVSSLCFVAIPATVFPLCVCGLVTLVSKMVFLVMALRHTRRSPGCRARSGPKESWQMRSQSMEGRNGLVSSVRRRMCGPGGVAGVVGITSRRVCKPNMSRRCMRRVKSGIQAHRLRVGEKSGSLRSRKKSRGCGPKLSCSASSKEKGRVQRSRANRQGKEVARKKDARWTLKARQTFRSWMQEKPAAAAAGN